MESEYDPLEQQTATTAVRIRRKRNADPQEELISIKRSCQSGYEGRDATASLYSLVGTSNPPEVSGISGLPSSASLIDFEPAKASDQMDVQMTANHSGVSNARKGLGSFHDDVGHGDMKQKQMSKESYQVIINGVQVEPNNTSELHNEAYHTFDSYRDPMVMSCSPEDDEIRFADHCHIKIRVGYDTDSDTDSDDEDSGEESYNSDQYPYDEDIEDWNDGDSSDSDDLAMKLNECEFTG